MTSSICSMFRTVVPQWNHNTNKNNLRCYWTLTHWNKNRKKPSFSFTPLIIVSSFKDDSISPSPNPKQSQMSYDPSEDLFGVSADLQPRKAISSGSAPRSWFGPNGQYIRELPCPNCRGRGYIPCGMCGIERSRLDCSQCNGKGMVTCHQCLGECVIWEESIDERPWEKARLISPFKVKEDDEVDNLEIKLAARKKSKRVYQSPSPEVGLKISRSLKSLNAKTGLFTNRMKIIHGDPKLHAQRVAAIKKSKGSVEARKHASESMKAFFSDPENRRQRSISMKGVKFYCKNCGREGHRRHYCPELDQTSADRWFRCSLCGEKGHNRRSCKKSDTIELVSRSFKLPCCSICGHPGHNRRTCLERTKAAATTTKTTLIKKTSSDAKKRAYTCRVCQGEGHNIRTCLQRTKAAASTTTTTKTTLINSSDTKKRAYTCRVCQGEGHNIRTCLQRTKAAASTTAKTTLIKKTSSDTKKRAYTCRVCQGVGHNIRTCPSTNTHLVHL